MLTKIDTGIFLETLLYRQIPSRANKKNGNFTSNYDSHDILFWEKNVVHNKKLRKEFSNENVLSLSWQVNLIKKTQILTKLTQIVKIAEIPPKNNNEKNLPVLLCLIGRQDSMCRA